MKKRIRRNTGIVTKKENERAGMSERRKRKRFLEKLLAAGLSTMLLFTVPINAFAETYEYDNLNRVTKVTYDDGSYVTYEYDKNGNITNIEVHEAETTKKQGTTEEETTKKPSGTEKETTKKQVLTEDETTKKQGTTEKETTKKPSGTEKETTKKQVVTEKETTKKQQETTTQPQYPVKNPQKPQATPQLPAIRPQVPTYNHIPGSSAFDVIKGELNEITGSSGSGNSYLENGDNYGITGSVSENNTSWEGGTGSKTEQQGNSNTTTTNKTGSSNKTGTTNKTGSSSKTNTSSKTGSSNKNGTTNKSMSKQEFIEYINQKMPKILVYVCERIVDIMKFYLTWK